MPQYVGALGYTDGRTERAAAVQPPGAVILVGHVKGLAHDLPGIVNAHRLRTPRCARIIEGCEKRTSPPPHWTRPVCNREQQRRKTQNIEANSLKDYPRLGTALEKDIGTDSFEWLALPGI